MTAAVGNPGAAGSGRALRFMGSASYTTPGMSTIKHPVGAKYARVMLRAGGGAGAGWIGYVSPAIGGGQGGFQRFWVKLLGSQSVLTIGKGGTPHRGASGDDGQPSSLFGYVALPGKGGHAPTNSSDTANPPSAGGVGADGVEPPTLGYGSYSGSSTSTDVGAGSSGGVGYTLNGTDRAGNPGTLGCGGAGGASTTGQTSSGGPGGDGYCYLEYFG